MESQNGPGPSVPGRVRSVPSRQMSVQNRSSSDENVMSLARTESRADFPASAVATSGSLGMEVGGVQWFTLPRRKHFSSRGTFHLVRCSICRVVTRWEAS